jgi:hypothetical protein
MAKKSPEQSMPDIATRIMERMVRMPPKPHKEMKLGKGKPSKKPTSDSKFRPARKGRVHKGKRENNEL